MMILHTFLLILVGLLGSVALEDLSGQALVFPEQSNTAHVIVRIPRQRQPLRSFTVCLRFYTDLKREYSLFSYATRQNDNHILIFKRPPNQYILYVDGDGVTFTAENQGPKPQWEHICFSWDSHTGLVEFWLNGVSFPRKAVKQGHMIPTQASVILGQEQDSFGGGFDANQSFVGEMEELRMSDRVVLPEDLDQVRNDSSSFNLIDWNSFDYVIQGNVIETGSRFPGP